MTERGIGDLAHSIARVLETDMSYQEAEELAEAIVKSPHVQWNLNRNGEKIAQEWVDELGSEGCACPDYDDTYDERYDEGYDDGHAHGKAQRDAEEWNEGWEIGYVKGWFQGQAAYAKVGDHVHINSDAVTKARENG